MLLSPMDLPLISSEEYIKENANYDLTIVHELLHLHFAPFQESDDTPKGVAQEQAINCISQAIIRGYTGKVPTPAPPVGEPLVGNYL